MKHRNLLSAGMILFFIVLISIVVITTPLSKESEVILHGLGGSFCCALFLGTGFLKGSNDSFSEKLFLVLCCALFGFFLGLAFYLFDVIGLYLTKKTL